MATLYIENKPYEVKPGNNLLEACLSLGFDLPYFCYHPALGSVGACRQCAIKVFKGEEDKKGKLVMSCMEPVTNDQRISITDAEAHEFRENVIGWLMTNHPHDCAVCDEGGSCHLQDMTVMTGHAYRKFNYLKRTYRNQYLGPFLNHEMNRCIQCYRCVRFYKDYAGGHDLDAFASRNNVYFGRASDGVLENEFSGNLAEVCPTGVFTDKSLKKHYTRKWDLTMSPSICQHCSLGCNTIAGERYGSLRMIGNRYNGEVNGYFLCDRGRFGYEFVNGDTRIRQPQKRNGISTEVTVGQVMDQLSSLQGSRIIGIGSERASLESNYALKKIAGENNFYHGQSALEHRLASKVNQIVSSGIRTLSMKEVEKADAVFILGEDLTNTAPMLALAVRQSVRQQPNRKADEAKIPSWDDAAVRGLIQQEQGPLFIASLTKTKLDEVATTTFQAAPDDLTRLGMAVAHAIDAQGPFVEGLSNVKEILAQNIAKALMEAECPVIISGTSSGSVSVIEAAANIALALQKKNSSAGLVLALPACNTMGLSLLEGDSFERIMDGNDPGEVLVILENDLYQHGHESRIDTFLKQFKHVIHIDHTLSQTTGKASIVIPAGTFAESDGTLVNNEGRAQRYFQVYEPGNGVLESWRWLIEIGKALKITEVEMWRNHDDIINAMAGEKTFKGIDAIAPNADFRINGQKVARQSHRYSGRTSMLANVNVSEPKPSEDHDSAMTYTMEGSQTKPPSSMIPFYWSPGWNSVQSVNKYQEEIGGHLQGGDPGKRLVSDGNQLPYFTNIPASFDPITDQLLTVPLHHIFGSDELSSLSPGVAERSPNPYIAMNEHDILNFGKKEGEILEIQIGEQLYTLPVKINNSIPKGIAGIPVSLRTMAYCDLPSWATIKK